MKYEVETGLNAKQQPVIVCSPDFYDQLICECRALSDMKNFNNLKAVNPDLYKKMAEFTATMFPALTILSQHPSFSEIKSQN